MGILADEERSTYATPIPLDQLSEKQRRLATSGELLIVDKANARSPVHRDERMDYVGVRRVTPDGEIAGEARLLGLFTSKAYSEPASETPVLHRKLRRVLEAEDLIEGSHDYKGAVALFDTFPKDELFAAPVDDLRRAVVALLALEGTDRVRLLGRRSVDGRSASFILALPRDRYRTVLVDRVRKLFMRRFKARDVEAQHMLGEGGTRVRVHFRVHAPDGLPDVPNPELEREVVQLARTWDDALSDALVERYGAAPRPAAVLDLGVASARPLQGLHGADHRRQRHRAARAAGRGRAVPRLAAAAAHPHARRALRARAEDRARRRAADARGPRAARDRGDLDPARGRRRDLDRRSSASSAPTAGRWTSRTSARASPSCWPPSTAATPRPTTSTGS